MDIKWLNDMLARPGYSQAGLAQALKRHPSAINRIVNGERQIKASEVPTILAYLEIGADEPVPVGTQRIEREPAPAPAERPDVPVWASAEAGIDGAMVLTSGPIDFIRRSERMQGVRNPFAFYVIGSSMSPAIEHGDQVVVNPAVPVRTGADCVFVHDDGGGTMLALVKRLLRTTTDAWRVRQFNPERDFELPKKKWSRAMVITEKRYG